MGIIERREREREEVRRKILDAARELFTTEGYDRVTMRRIADAIEYSPTTIYNHFEDKQALVESLCQEDFGRLLEAFGQTVPPEDPVEWIRQLGLAYARFGIENPNHYRFMFMTPIKPTHESPTGNQTYELLRLAVRKAIAAGRLRISDVETASQVLWATLHGAVALLVTYGEGMPNIPMLPDLVERVVENGLRGLVKEA